MAKRNNKIITMGLALGLLMSGLVNAQQVIEDEVAERQRVLGVINNVMHDAAKTQAAIDSGRDRSMLCSHCHGVDGNSKRPDIPNLADQNPAYLLEQIDMFADGRRKNFVMNTLTKDFTPEDRVNLAVFYSSQEVAPQEYDAVKAQQGGQKYQQLCMMCHGQDGRGGSEHGYARVAGQKMEFVKFTLKRFRTNATNKDPNRKVKRTNQRMEQVTANLSDSDIELLANYIASLK